MGDGPDPDPPAQPERVGDLLAGDANQVSKLLAAAQINGQLAGALGTLTATETGDLLAATQRDRPHEAARRAPTAQLQSALATLLPAELASVVDGLTAGQTAGLLTAANPTQLTSLLGALDGGQLTSALGTLSPRRPATCWPR